MLGFSNILPYSCPRDFFMVLDCSPSVLMSRRHHNWSGKIFAISTEIWPLLVDKKHQHQRQRKSRLSQMRSDGILGCRALSDVAISTRICTLLFLKILLLASFMSLLTNKPIDVLVPLHWSSLISQFCLFSPYLNVIIITVSGNEDDILEAFAPDWTIRRW